MGLPFWKWNRTIHCKWFHILYVWIKICIWLIFSKINFTRVMLFCLLSRGPLSFNGLCFTYSLSLRFTLIFEVSTVTASWKDLLILSHQHVNCSLKLWNLACPVSCGMGKWSKEILLQVYLQYFLILPLLFLVTACLPCWNRILKKFEEILWSSRLYNKSWICTPVHLLQPMYKICSLISQNKFTQNQIWTLSGFFPLFCK